MGIFEDYDKGINSFSPLAMTSERKFARAAAPALGAAMGHENAATLAANAQAASSYMGARAHVRTENIRDIGETLRRNLLDASNQIIEGMRQAGETGRNKYTWDTHRGMNTDTIAGQMDRLKTGERLERSLLNYRAGLASEANREAGPRRPNSQGLVDQFGGGPPPPALPNGGYTEESSPYEMQVGLSTRRGRDAERNFNRFQYPGMTEDELNMIPSRLQDWKYDGSGSGF